jgi:dynein heavy chain
MCKTFHENIRVLSQLFLVQLSRHNYVTPTSYLELILTFKGKNKLSRFFFVWNFSFSEI